MKDIVCVGHVTLDKIVTPEKEVYMPGGTTFYMAHGISHLPSDKVSFKLVASLAESEMKAVEDMRKVGIEVDVIPSKKSVFFENIYGENQNDRKQRVRAKADPFTVESVKGIEAKYICLGSLLADDFPLEVVKELSQHGTIVMDAQGYLREVRGEKVYPCDWENKLEFFKYIDILKVNEQEIYTLTGIENYKEACAKLAEWGIKEVLLTLGSEGSMLYINGECHEIKACKPAKVVDATGCGDTFQMGYLYMRAQGATAVDAANFASAVCSLKIEHNGPFSGSIEDVEERLKG